MRSAVDGEVPYRVKILILGATVFGVTAPGCDNAARPAVIMRDSAGVEIVESREAEWGEVSPWRAGAHPRTVVGAAEGQDSQQIHRVAGVTLIGNSTIVVANAGSYELRAYDRTGTHQWSSGRQGAGPGEFRNIRWMHSFAGDSLLTYDQSLGRLTVHDGSGRFVRTFELERVGEAGPFPRMPLDEGSLIATVGVLFQAGEIETGVKADSTHGLVFSTSGALLDTVDIFPGNEIYLETDGRRMTVMEYPFGRATFFAASGGLIYFGWHGAYDIRVYSPDGGLNRIVRRPGPARPITDDLARGRKEEVLAGIENEGYRRVVERIYRDLSVTGRDVPAFAGLVVDGSGYIWVRRYPDPGEPGDTWDVFHPEGRWLGNVEMPRDLEVVEIGDTYVLGVWRSELGVEQVRLYPLIRNQT